MCLTPREFRGRARTSTCRNLQGPEGRIDRSLSRAARPRPRRGRRVGHAEGRGQSPPPEPSRGPQGPARPRSAAARRDRSRAAKKRGAPRNRVCPTPVDGWCGGDKAGPKPDKGGRQRAAGPRPGQAEREAPNRGPKRPKATGGQEEARRGGAPKRRTRKAANAESGTRGRGHRPGPRGPRTAGPARGPKRGEADRGRTGRARRRIRGKRDVTDARSDTPADPRMRDAPDAWQRSKPT